MKIAAMKHGSPIILALVFGCAVGPDYKRPKTVVEEKNTPFTATAPESTSDSLDLFSWWTLFQDETLAGLLQEVRTSNLDVKQAVSRVEEFKALYRVARAPLGPKVEIDGSAQRSRLSTNTPLGAAIQGNGGDIVNNQFQIGPSLSWELDIFGGLRREKGVAFAEWNANVENLRAVYIQMLASVSKTYLQLRETQMRLTVAEKNLQSQKEAYGIANARYQAGIVSELDPSRAKVLLSSSAAQIPLLKIAESEMIHRLSVLLGKSPNELQAQLGDKKDLPGLPDHFAMGLPSDLLQRRPDIRQAEARLQAETARVGSAKADYFPRFSLTGNFGFQSIDAGNLLESNSIAWSVGPTIRWPIFQMGAIRAKVAAQGKRAEGAAVAYEYSILKALEQVENALVSFGYQKQYVATMDEAVKNARRAVDVSQDRYKAGLSNFLEVVDAERDLFSVEDKQIQGTSNVRLALVNLYEALGGGWQTGLAEEKPSASPAVK